MYTWVGTAAALLGAAEAGAPRNSSHPSPEIAALGARLEEGDLLACKLLAPHMSKRRPDPWAWQVAQHCLGPETPGQEEVLALLREGRPGLSAMLAGLALRKANDDPGAVAAARRSVQEAPGLGVAWLELARSLQANWQAEEAVQAAETALRLMPDSDWAREELATSTQLAGAPERLYARLRSLPEALPAMPAPRESCILLSYQEPPEELHNQMVKLLVGLAWKEGEEQDRLLAEAPAELGPQHIDAITKVGLGLESSPPLAWMHYVDAVLELAFRRGRPDLVAQILAQSWHKFAADIPPKVGRELARALLGAKSADPAAQVQLRVLGGQALLLAGAVDESAEVLRSLSLSPTTAQLPGLRVVSMQLWAEAQVKQGQTGPALETLVRARALARSAGLIEGDITIDIGELHYLSGNPAASLEEWRALRSTLAPTEWARLASTWDWESACLLGLEQLEGAQAARERARFYYEKIGDTSSLARSWHLEAELAHKAGQWERAASLARLSRRTYGAALPPEADLMLLFFEAIGMLNAGDAAGALLRFQELQARAADMNNEPLRLTSQFQEGLALARLERWEEVDVRLESTCGLMTAETLSETQLLCYGMLATSQIMQKRMEEGIGTIDLVLRMSEERGQTDLQSSGDLKFLRCLALSDLKRDAEALACMQALSRDARPAGGDQQSEAHSWLAEMELQRSQVDRAMLHYDEAIHLSGQRGDAAKVQTLALQSCGRLVGAQLWDESAQRCGEVAELLHQLPSPAGEGEARVLRALALHHLGREEDHHTELGAACALLRVHGTDKQKRACDEALRKGELQPKSGAGDP